MSKRLDDYLLSLESFPDEKLNLLRRNAEEAQVPIIRPVTESLLRTLLAMCRPQRILEIGTAVGYSSIMMAGCTNATIDTIENYEPRIRAARQNLADAGLTERITLMEGDAGEILRQLAEHHSFAQTDTSAFPGVSDSSFASASDITVGYDFVFLDAAKGQYLHWLPDILRLMHAGSLLVADNVLQDETVCESRFAIPRRERTTHVRMREFLYQIRHDPRLQTSIVPVGDGVSISVYIA